MNWIRATLYTLFVTTFTCNLWAYQPICQDIFGQLAPESSTDATEMVVSEGENSLTTSYSVASGVRKSVVMGTDQIKSLIGEFEAIRNKATPEGLTAIEALLGEDGLIGNYDFLQIAWKWMGLRAHYDVHKPLRKPGQPDYRRDQVATKMREMSERLKFEIEQKGEVSFEVMDFFVSKIAQSIEDFYSRPEDQVHSYLKNHLNGSAEKTFVRQKALAEVKKHFWSEQVKTILWSLTLANMTTLKQFRIQDSASGHELIVAANKDELLPTEDVGTGLGIGTAVAVDSGVAYVGGLLITGIEWVLFGTQMSAMAGPAAAWATYHYLVDGPTSVKLFLTRLRRGKDKRLAEINGGLIGQFIKTGDIKLLASPSSSQLDGRYNTPRLEASKIIDIDKFQRDLRVADDTELSQVIADFQSDLNSALVAAGSPFYFTDKDYQQVVANLKKAMANELKGRKPPRKLRTEAGLNHAFLMLTRRAEEYRKGVADSRVVVGQLSQAINLIDEIIEDSDFKEEILEQLIRTRNDKKDALSSFAAMASELDKVASEVRGRIFTNAALVVNNTVVEIGSNGSTVKGLVPAGRTTEMLLRTFSGSTSVDVGSGADGADAQLPVPAAGTQVAVLGAQGAQLPALTTQNSSQQKVYELLSSNRYKPGQIQEVLEVVNNDFQVQVISSLVQNKVSVVDHLYWISQIDNAFQVRVADLYVKNGHIGPKTVRITTFRRKRINKTPAFMNRIGELQNEYQLEVFRLLYQSNYGPSKYINSIFKYTNNYQVAAIRALIQAKRNITNSIELVLGFDNDFQVRAVELLLEYNKADVVGKIPGIVEFDNEHQIAALKAMLDGGKEIAETIFLLAKIDNEHQAKVVDLTTRSEYTVRKNMDQILRVNTDFQFRAIRAYINSGQSSSNDFDSFLKELVEIRTEPAALATEALMQRDRKLSNKFVYLTRLKEVSNESQVEVIRLLSTAGLDFLQEFSHILEMNRDNQAEMVRVMFAIDKGYIIGNLKFIKRFSNPWAFKTFYYYTTIQNRFYKDSKNQFLIHRMMRLFLRVTTEEQYKKAKSFAEWDRFVEYLSELPEVEGGTGE